MALVLKDRVRETSTVLGTADATLLGAVTGYQAFSAIGNGNTCYYTIADNSGNWEVGIGTYSTVGPTLARTTVISSSNANAKVSFPAGTKDVFVTYPAEYAAYVDGSNIVPGTASTVPTTYGGTGLSSYTAGDITYYAAGTALSKLSIGTNGQVLKSNGTSPAWADATTLAVTSISFGTTGLTPSTATQGAVTVSGTLATANGGTGLTTFNANGALYATSSSALTTGTLPTTSGGTGLASYSAGDLVYYATGTALSKLTIGTNGYVLKSNGTAPVWESAANVSVTTFSGGTTGLTPSTPTGGAVTLGGTLALTNGGTGATTAAQALVNLGERTGATGATILPAGTTAQQPAGVAGYIRFNTDSSKFEGYNGTAWGTIGGGSAISNDTATATVRYPLFADATSGTPTTIYTSNAKYLYKPSTGELQSTTFNANNGIFTNANTINANQTIAAATNGGSFGPVSIASGVTITVESGAVWTVV